MFYPRLWLSRLFELMALRAYKIGDGLDHWAGVTDPRDWDAELNALEHRLDKLG